MNGLPPNMLILVQYDKIYSCIIILPCRKTNHTSAKYNESKTMLLNILFPVPVNPLDMSISARQGCDPLPRCTYFTPWVFQRYIMNGRS